MLDELKIITYWKRKLSPYIKLEDSNILEIGCGEGIFGKLLAKNTSKRYLGIDPNRKAVLIAKKNCPKNAVFKIGRAEKIPSKNKFEVVFFTFSWHFISDFNKSISELQRVLNPKGVIVIIEPTKHASNWKDSRLNKRSTDFSKELFSQKLRALEHAETRITNQKTFRVVHQKINNKKYPSIWILSNQQNYCSSSPELSSPKSSTSSS